MFHQKGRRGSDFTISIDKGTQISIFEAISLAFLFFVQRKNRPSGIINFQLHGCHFALSQMPHVKKLIIKLSHSSLHLPK
jgi:hypothetical protein